jgi:hypothetical protein
VRPRSSTTMPRRRARDAAWGSRRRRSPCDRWSWTGWLTEDPTLRAVEILGAGEAGGLHGGESAPTSSCRPSAQPRLAVFDRPQTVAFRWGRDGQITESGLWASRSTAASGSSCATGAPSRKSPRAAGFGGQLDGGRGDEQPELRWSRSAHPSSLRPSSWHGVSHTGVRSARAVVPVSDRERFGDVSQSLSQSGFSLRREPVSY